MKYSILLGLLFSFSAMAKAPSLFVKDSGKLLDVEELIAAEEDIQSIYGFESFCYKGDPNAVMTKIKSWKKKGQFFSGDGGGHVLRGMTLIRGIVTYDIAMRFEDEVVPGEFDTQIVKPCTAR